MPDVDLADMIARMLPEGVRMTRYACGPDGDLGKEHKLLLADFRVTIKDGDVAERDLMRMTESQIRAHARRRITVAKLEMARGLDELATALRKGVRDGSEQ